jgi:hypothetical protein
MQAIFRKGEGETFAALKLTLITEASIFVTHHLAQLKNK